METQPFPYSDLGYVGKPERHEAEACNSSTRDVSTAGARQGDLGGVATAEFSTARQAGSGIFRSAPLLRC
jgi:hypothetical protein